MTKRMLIDAVHASERRVAIVADEKLLEFDFETLNNQNKKGNIYLAKVVRVEPSLQAAFLDYGQDRHGFLAFSDIQHSNYQIPIEDREALAAEQERILAESEVSEEIDETFDSDDLNLAARIESDDDTGVAVDAGDSESSGKDADADSDDDDDSDDDTEEYDIEISGGSADEPEAEKPRKKAKSLFDFYRRYKIQEVVKRGQIMLVQIVKDERGNKGAAFTTYVSLPGRYCVLMPNAVHKGGVSRKISDVKDRRRLRKIVESLELPKNISLIVRTAGKDRNKMEIRRDSEYLMRLWDEVREKTLSSNAPALIYEEGDLIRQSIRDLYRKEMIEVLVDGEQAHKEAKAYMKQLSPSHAVRVKRHADKTTSLFAKYGVESALSEMYSHEVTLKSGGYLIINHTEALVSIDINSGRATRERNIVDTAYKTNLEAAEEIARQVRLRNLAGLVVIDFIDMDNNKHISAVERKFRECMRDDRARVQIGNISQFGLMEFSRQRMGASYLETITQACGHCHGRGVVPAKNLLGLRTLRKIQELVGSARGEGAVTLRIPADAALYVLNNMRDALATLETSISRQIVIIPDAALVAEDAVIDGEPQQKDVVKGQRARRSTNKPHGGAQEKQGTRNPAQGRGARPNAPRGDQLNVSEGSTNASSTEGAPLVAGGNTDTNSPAPEGSASRSRNRRRNRNRRGASADSSIIPPAEGATSAPGEDGVVIPISDSTLGQNADTTGSATADGDTGRTDSPADARADGQAGSLADSEAPRRKRTRRRRPRARTGGSDNIIPPAPGQIPSADRADMNNPDSKPSASVDAGQQSERVSTKAADQVSGEASVQTSDVNRPNPSSQSLKGAKNAASVKGAPVASPAKSADGGQSSSPAGDAEIPEKGRKRKGWWSRLVESDDAPTPKDDT